MPDDDDPEGIIARYRDRVCAGSHLVLSQFASDSDPDVMGELRAVAAGTPVETYSGPGTGSGGSSAVSSCCRLA